MLKVKARAGHSQETKIVSTVHVHKQIINFKLLETGMQRKIIKGHKAKDTRKDGY